MAIRGLYDIDMTPYKDYSTVPISVTDEIEKDLKNSKYTPSKKNTNNKKNNTRPKGFSELTTFDDTRYKVDMTPYKGALYNDYSTVPISVLDEIDTDIKNSKYIPLGNNDKFFTTALKKVGNNLTNTLYSQGIAFKESLKGPEQKWYEKLNPPQYVMGRPNPIPKGAVGGYLGVHYGPVEPLSPPNPDVPGGVAGFLAGLNKPQQITPPPVSVLPDNDSVNAYVNSILSSQGDATLEKPTYLTPPVYDQPSKMGLSELANMYGITYDYDALYKQLSNAVDKQYDTIYGKQEQNEGKYYDNAHTAQNTLMDTLNRQQSSAVSSGVNKGMQAANLISAALGVSQQFADNATALSQERSNIANAYGESLAKAATQAEQASYERRAALAKLSEDLYNAEIQKYTADLGLNADYYTANAGLQSNYLNSLANLKSTNINSAANLASNYLSNQTSLANTNSTNAANIAMTNANSAANTYAAEVAARASLEANKGTNAYYLWKQLAEQEAYERAKNQQPLDTGAKK